MSKTPSWIMLGFVIGCIVGVSVVREYDRRSAKEVTVQKPPEIVPAKLPTQSPIAAKDQPSLSGVEAVFEQSRQWVVWDKDVTEVALLNPVTQKFSDYFEVMRSGENVYFRTIPQLTRAIVPYDPPPSLLMQFTEPDEARKWRIRRALEDAQPKQ